MREILILDCPEIVTICVLITVFTEMCGALIRKGHNLKVIHNINEMHNNSIIFMGDKPTMKALIGGGLIAGSTAILRYFGSV